MEKTEPCPHPLVRRKRNSASSLAAPSQGEEDHSSELDTVDDDESDVGDNKEKAVAVEGSADERDRSSRIPREADETAVEKLLHAIWQKQDQEWTVSFFSKSAFQQLCIKNALDWSGTRKDMYQRLKPVVRHSVFVIPRDFTHNRY